jgi:hypothetical protein
MNTYFVIFLTKDQDKCELVRKVKNELDFIAFEEYVKNKIMQDDLVKICTWYKAQLEGEGYTMTNRYEVTCGILNKLTKDER